MCPQSRRSGRPFCNEQYRHSWQFFCVANPCDDTSDYIQGKNKALADAGAIVPDSFEAFEGDIAKTFKKLVDDGKLVPQSNVKAPTLPLDLEAAKKSGTVSLTTAVHTLALLYKKKLVGRRL